MVNFTVSPRPEDGQKDRISGEDTISLAMEVNDRIRDCLARSGPWLSDAHNSLRYYKSDQNRRRVGSKDRHRIRLIANFIRRDVDQISAEVLDSKPVVNPVGRRPKDYELGRQLMEVLIWTRDEEENWDRDIERCITACVHIGEGVLFEGWDQDADQGQGRPICMALDSRYVFWDPDSEDLQRDDAEFVIWVAQERVGKVEEDWPQLAGKVQAETHEVFLSPGGRQLGGKRDQPGVGNRGDKDAKVWVRRQWSKKMSWEKRYFYKDTGEQAMVWVAEDEMNEVEAPLDASTYKDLAPEEKEMIVVTRHRKTEMWETVVVNETVVEHHISPFDESEGGHGKYPFAFFSYEVLADEHRARGEISFLMSIQDIMNETITQMMEQLFLNNVGYWHTYKGSLSPEERAKFNTIFYQPHKVIETVQGLPPPEHRGVDSTGLQASASVVPMIKDIADTASGVRDVDRGNAPGYIQSGRAIRALQAKTSLLNVKVRRHIEAGLRRATTLRLHNIMQFFRGNRVIEVTDPGTRNPHPLFIGHDEMEIAMYHGLSQQPDPETGEMAWVTKEGDEAEIMVLNDELARDVVFERVRLTLDTGQEANRLERMDQAEMVLNTVGKAAIPWAAKQLEWSNVDELLEAIEREDQALQAMARDEKFQQENGMSVDEALQMVSQAGQGAVQPEGAPAPQGTPMPPQEAPMPPQGTPMPPGGPQGQPISQAVPA